MGPQGFEPWTHGLKVRRSTMLSYRPTNANKGMREQRGIIAILGAMGCGFKGNFAGVRRFRAKPALRLMRRVCREIGVRGWEYAEV